MSDPAKQGTPVQEPASGCFVRLAWMLICNVVLVISLISIIRGDGAFFSMADAVFWVALVAAVGLRHLDVARLGGQTVFGQPATMAHWYRYAVLLSAVAGLAWVLAHVLARTGT